MFFAVYIWCHTTLNSYIWCDVHLRHTIAYIFTLRNRYLSKYFFEAFTPDMYKKTNHWNCTTPFLQCIYCIFHSMHFMYIYNYIPLCIQLYNKHSIRYHALQDGNYCKVCSRNHILFSITEYWCWWISSQASLTIALWPWSNVLPPKRTFLAN